MLSRDTSFNQPARGEGAGAVWCKQPLRSASMTCLWQADGVGVGEDMTAVYLLDVS
jgi:hypothetical protein